jgi:4a-hydroxytetrahydrobiopterin dehydratase
MDLHTACMSVPDGWVEADGALERTFELPSFPEAIAFVNRVAELAQAEDHHPDVTISYKKVTLRWTTHSEGGITERDRVLAVRSAALVAAQ